MSCNMAYLQEQLKICEDIMRESSNPCERASLAQNIVELKTAIANLEKWNAGQEKVRTRTEAEEINRALRDYPYSHKLNGNGARND